MTRLIRKDFGRKMMPAPPLLTTARRDLEGLAYELKLPQLAALYGEGKETELHNAAFDNTQVSITLHPMADDRPPAYKGFDLRVTVREGDKDPYTYALFFREKEPNRFYMNGCLYARDESGYMLWPKLHKDEILRAVTRMYLSHTLEKDVRPVSLSFKI